MSLVTAQEFAARDATAKGVKLRVTEAGAGRPVIVIGAGFAGGGAHSALAARFHVTAVESNEDGARKLGEALAALAEGAEKVGVVGIGAHAGAALAAAHTLGERACALVFVSPAGLPIGAGANADDPLAPLLRGVLTPKLIMLGHDDKAQPPDAPRLYRRSLSRSNVILIYNSGAAIAADRPHAFANVAGDFLDRQDRYRFMTESVAIGS